MADKAPKRWKRRINSDVARFPIHTRSYPDPITGVADPNHEDEDMREHLTPVSESPQDFERQEGSWDVENSVLVQRGEFDTMAAPTIWSARKDATGRGARSVECRRCGRHVLTSKTKEVPIEGEPYFGRVCSSGCQNWDSEKRPFGARRRKY